MDVWSTECSYNIGIDKYDLLGPVDPSFRALSGRLKLTVRRHKFNKDSRSKALESEVVFPSFQKSGFVGRHWVLLRHRHGQVQPSKALESEVVFSSYTSILGDMYDSG